MKWIGKSNLELSSCDLKTEGASISLGQSPPWDNVPGETIQHLCWQTVDLPSPTKKKTRTTTLHFSGFTANVTVMYRYQASLSKYQFLFHKRPTLKCNSLVKDIEITVHCGSWRKSMVEAVSHTTAMGPAVKRGALAPGAMPFSKGAVPLTSGGIGQLFAR